MTAPRQTKRVPFAAFEQTQKILGLEGGELSEKLGYAVNSWHEWKNSGQMPKVAQLACEALCQGKPMAKEKIFLIRSGGKEDAIKLMLKALNVEFVEI